MNIFVVSKNPRIAAKFMCDKHIVKMITESGQMLCTAWWMMDPEYAKQEKLYKPTHPNHPCNLWIRSSAINYLWLYEHLEALLKQYRLRYGNTGKFKSIKALMPALMEHPFNRDSILEEPMRYAVAMKKYPECVGPDVVASYRRFYIVDKHKFAKWDKGVEAPKWYTKGLKKFKKCGDITKVPVTKEQYAQLS